MAVQSVSGAFERKYHTLRCNAAHPYRLYADFAAFLVDCSTDGIQGEYSRDIQKESSFGEVETLSWSQIGRCTGRDVLTRADTSSEAEHVLPRVLFSSFTEETFGVEPTWFSVELRISANGPGHQTS